MFEMLHGVLHVAYQQLRQVAAETMPRNHALDHGLPAIGRQWIRSHLPAANPQPVAEIVQRIAGIDAVLDLPRATRQPAAAIVNQFERTELRDLRAEPRP